MTRRSGFASMMFGVALACGWLPSNATLPMLTFNGVTSVVGTGSISLSAPVGITVDSRWNTYLADTGNNQIVKIAADGTSSVVAITGVSPATLSSPKGVVADSSGNLLIADTGNSRIIKVDTSGSSSVVSTGSVALSAPQSVAVDGAGNIFISDTGNNQIVEVPASGSASVFSISGLASPSTLSSPRGLTTDAQGNLYIADAGNSRVVKVSSAGAGSTLAIAGVTPTTPVSVAVDSYGTLFVADSGDNQIVKVTTDLSGSDFSTQHALTTSAPAGVAVDLFGNVLVADTGNNQIESVQITSVGFGHAPVGASSNGDYQLVIGGTNGPDLTNLTVPTLGRAGLDFTTGGGTSCSAGTANQPTCIIDVQRHPVSPGFSQGGMILTYIDNSGSPSVTRSLTVPVYAFADAPQAALYPGAAAAVSTGSTATQTPYQVAVDGFGNMYVGNVAGKNVVKIPAAGGSATVVNTGSYTLGSGGGGVNGVAFDGSGNLFIADNGNSQIYQVHSAGTTYQLTINIAGSPTTLSGPTALAVDGAGGLFIADNGNNRILKVALKDPTLPLGPTFNGIVLSTGSYTFSGSSITAMAVDSSENLYVVDSNAGKVVKLTAAGGSSVVAFPTVTLSRPEGVAVDGMGNLYVSDGGTGQIIQLTTAGTASVVPVQGLTGPGTLGGGTGQHLYGVTVDSTGNIYIADSSNNRVVKIPVTQADLSFPNAASGATGGTPLTAKVTNLGNQPLVFAANPAYTGDFSENSAGANPCTSATSLSPGTSCNVSATFTPQSVGNLSASITLTNNSLNVSGAHQVVSAHGTAVVGGDTTSTAVTVSPSPAAIGVAATISATVADTVASSSVPTGSVTFVDTIGSTTTTLNNGTAVALSNGTASLSQVFLIGVGTHTITANYAGVGGSFLPSSSSPTTLVVNKGTPTVTVTSSKANADVGESVAFTIAVSSLSSVPTTGSVHLLSGSTELGSAQLDSHGKATIATASLPAGTNTVTAQYSGDDNYLTATGSVSQVATGAGFSVTGPSDVVTQSISAPTPTTLTFQPVGGFVGTVTFSCTGLPPGKVCKFAPPSIVADGSDTPQTVEVTFVDQSAAGADAPAGSLTLRLASAQFAGLMVVPAMTCALNSRRGRGKRRSSIQRRPSRRGWARSMWAVASMVFAFCFLSACGSHHAGPTTYSVSVIATATQTGNGYQGPSVSTTVVKLNFVQ